MVSCVSAMNGATNLQNIKVTYFSTKNMKCGFNVHGEEAKRATCKVSVPNERHKLFLCSYLAGAENCSFKCKEEIIHKHKTYARAAKMLEKF